MWMCETFGRQYDDDGAVAVVETMNDYYQRCLHTCQQLRSSLSSDDAESSYVDVASLSASSLLYHYAIDSVRSSLLYRVIFSSCC